jgi:hypothetical protein
VLSAALGLSGAITKKISRTLTAVLSFFAELQAGGQVFLKTLTATLSFAGSFTKSTARTLSATLSFSGAIARAIQKNLTATLSFAGGLASLTWRVFETLRLAIRAALGLDVSSPMSDDVLELTAPAALLLLLQPGAAMTLDFTVPADIALEIEVTP